MPPDGAALMLSRVGSELFWTDDEVGLMHLLDEALHDTVDQDQFFFVILTAATAGGGFRFSRAAIFLREEPGGRVHGVMGIGPDDAAEAGAIWSSLAREDPPLRRMLAGYHHFAWQGAFNRRVRSLVFPPLAGDIFSRVIAGRDAFIVAPPYEDGLVPAPLARLVLEGQFVASPVIGREARVAGVLIGDNAFTLNAVNERQVRLLSFFGERAGSMVELVRTNRELAAHVRALRDAYRRLYLARRRLSESESLAALGRAVAAIEHEIKGPVSSIGMMAARVRHLSAAGSEAEKLGEEIYRKSLSLHDFIVRNLAGLRRKDDAARCDDLNGLVRAVLREARPAAGDGPAAVGVRVNCHPAPPPVSADAQQLRHALVNVLDNSFHYAAARPGGGGLVTVETVVERPDVLVLVGDNGAGIAPGQEELIFKPFFSTRAGGTGLGLSLARQLIEAHGGRISARPGGGGAGVRFEIRLPVAGGRGHRPAGGNREEKNTAG